MRRCRNQNRVGWRSASPWRLGHQYWGRILNESGLEPVYGDAFLPCADLDIEVLVVLSYDLIRAIVRGLERGLLEVPVYEYELRIGQVLGDVCPGMTMVAGGDGTEVPYPLT